MTRDDYDAQLEVLRRVIPGNPLLPRLLAGHTSTNARYVVRLMAENIAPAPRRTTRLITEPTTDEPNTPEWNALASRKRNLYHQRAKLSNRFHDVDSVNARADISRDIRHLQGKIKTVHQSMSYYRAHGRVPEDLQDQERAVYNEAELMKQRHALNAKMSRLRSNLKQAATAKPEKVKKWSHEMTECERERESISRKIGQIRL
jgi:hypothetical protein